MWQGYLYLKNDASNVQMHFITGSKTLVSGALKSVVEGGIVRIAQRMRLEASQLEGVAKRMQVRDSQAQMLINSPLIDMDYDSQLCCTEITAFTVSVNFSVPVKDLYDKKYDKYLLSALH